MTLKQIVERLELIELEIEHGDFDEGDEGRVSRYVESLRLDIERHILRTTGTL